MDIEMRSIMSHLRKLLNTDKGSVQIDPDYGMPDMTVFSSAGVSETMQRIEHAVLEVVRKYEKRLANVRVQIESSATDVLKINFRLEAEMARHRNMPVSLETSVLPGGKVNISRTE